ncbi:MAG: CopD family protein [Bacteroidia bacterium]|nr:CopD family protein [Bacteroidia bacterium]
MNVLYIKALHIIFVVTWFAGLFYLVRLFIYHTEASGKKEPEREILISHFLLAERRLWYGITWPSAILTWIFGVWLAYSMYGFAFPDWLVVKIGFVAGLSLYHLQCGIILKRLRRSEFRTSSFRLRIWNEVATLFLVAIVFIVVVKDSGNWWWGLAGLGVLSCLLFLAIYLYKKRRKD